MNENFLTQYEEQDANVCNKNTCRQMRWILECKKCIDQKKCEDENVKALKLIIDKQNVTVIEFNSFEAVIGGM